MKVNVVERPAHLENEALIKVIKNLIKIISNAFM